jgi:hypothetical protein
VNHRVSMCIPACTPLAMFCLCNGGERSLRQSGHQGICAVEGQVNELLVVDWRGHSGAALALAQCALLLDALLLDDVPPEEPPGTPLLNAPKFRSPKLP